MYLKLIAKLPVVKTQDEALHGYSWVRQDKTFDERNSWVYAP
jgi:hypothetical protein